MPTTLPLMVCGGGLLSW